jgi:hypothetical protein
MSTKTLRKRIALVAVGALGFGLLTVVSSPVANADNNATGLSLDAIRINTQTAGSNLAAGVCAIDPLASDNTYAAVASTATTISVGAKLQFVTGTDGLGSLVISGPAQWAGQPVSTSDLTGLASGATVSSDLKTVGFRDNAASAILVATGVGAVTVTAYNAATPAAATAVVETFGINVVASCAGVDTVSVANSILAIGASDTAATSTSTDLIPSYAQQAYGSTLYINVLLRDSFKAALATNVVLQATGTNGALVGIDAAGISSTGVAATKGSSSDNVSVYVSQDRTNKPGQALTTTVTVTANGTVIGTKTITLLGLAASIEVPQADVKYGTGTSSTTTTNLFKFYVKDNAGNRLEETPAATGAIGGTTYAATSGVSAVTTSGRDGKTWRTDLEDTASGWGEGTFTCSSTVSGSQSVTLGFFNTALVLVKSNPFTVNCSVGGISTFSVSTDKATYAPGEIATLSIKGLDVLGKPVADNTTMGADYVNLSMPGMTLIGAAATSADTFTAGVKTYKFRVDQAEGSFVGQAQPTATADDAAKTVSYTIKSAAGTVTNAEVLKSIVSLIASINKQIQALQKLILRR